MEASQASALSCVFFAGSDLMLESLSEASGLSVVFLVSATFGSVLFVARLLLQFFGGGDTMDGDIDLGDSDPGFQYLSIHGMSAFLLLFGLVGLALLIESGAGEFIAIAGGIVAGLLSLAVTGKVFQFMSRLHSSGTLQIEKAVGVEGTVYLRIPSEGRGKVQVAVQNRLMEFEAVSSDGEIATGESVLVVGIVGNNVLNVCKL